MSSESPTSLFHDIERLDVVALTMIEGFGPATIRAHLARIRDEGRPFDAGLAVSTVSAARLAARARMNAAGNVGARYILDGDDEYPDLLRALENPPVVLWVMGDLSVLNGPPTVSIVGTRNSSSYGERVTRDLASAFAHAGATVVSGMALGIDSTAHRAALDAGGTTAAVLGTGVDVPYPRSHRTLHERIVRQGVVLSEAPPGASAGPGCFPRRNRIIAALGKATIVVEAGIKSGARNTADWVGDMNRTLAAVPGPIDSPRSFGSNQLMRDGAQPITCMSDALALIGLSDTPRGEARLETPSEQSVWNALEIPAADFDVLCARTGLPARVCFETVTRLELRGIVECTLTGELRRR